MSKSKLAKEALDYHSLGKPGKIEVIPTKPCETQMDLTLAYSPGVAVPCLEIQAKPETANLYTSKANLVAVLTNGTAVLGLGNIGALAGKPVMEGKGILFKRFADIDVFDIEMNSEKPEELIRACQMLEPTFGGINLEDIKAPECFIIEEELKRTMNIPVFHDDQHGTAIVASAALLNAIDIVGKKISEVKVTMNGAGASGLAIAKLLVRLGVKKDNLIMCDTKGVIYKGRSDGMNKYKEELATNTTKRTLADAMKGADVVLGLSAKGAFSNDMIKSLAPNPIIMAMANPDPEITPEEVAKIRKDCIMATGRSDYPNQVNNVLCFPYLFRGALDTESVAINEEMKIAAAKALADLARLDVPETVLQAYGLKSLAFGREYIIPKPFDPRVLTHVTIAVAKAAIATKSAKKIIKDFDAYKASLEARLDPARRLANSIINKAKTKKAKIIFAHGEDEKSIRAARELYNRSIASAILVGSKSKITTTATTLKIDLKNIEIIDPETYKDTDKFIADFYARFARVGITHDKAVHSMRVCRNRFSATLLKSGVADGMIAYASKSYYGVVHAVSDILDTKHDYFTVSTCSILSSKTRDLFLTDRVLSEDEEDYDAITDRVLQTVDTANLFGITNPKTALVNNSNFMSEPSIESADIMEAIEDLKISHPKLIIDGEMTIDVALDSKKAAKFPFNKIQGDADVVAFADIKSADAVYRSLRFFGGYKRVATVLQGFEKPVQIVKPSTSVEDIITLAAIVASAKGSPTKTAKKVAKKSSKK